MHTKSLTHARLLEVLDYDENTGDFTWKVRLSKRIHVGDTAGCAKTPDKYPRIRIDGVLHLTHRLAWFYVNGEYPVDGQIDHISRDRTDTKIGNMRSVTDAGNKRNLPTPSNNKSGHIGVSWQPERGKWQAYINTDEKRIPLGRFYNLKDAVAARKKAEVKYGYHPNHGS